jgi:hypothetical protein
MAAGRRWLTDDSLAVMCFPWTPRHPGGRPLTRLVCPRCYPARHLARSTSWCPRRPTATSRQRRGASARPRRSSSRARGRGAAGGRPGPTGARRSGCMGGLARTAMPAAAAASGRCGLHVSPRTYHVSSSIFFFVYLHVSSWPSRIASHGSPLLTPPPATHCRPPPVTTPPPTAANRSPPRSPLPPRDAWLALLSLPLPPDSLRRALLLLPSAVLPHVFGPHLLSDFLTHALDAGGLTGILALNGLFQLVRCAGARWALACGAMWWACM